MKGIRVTLFYECGKCGNTQLRTYESKDGLLELPSVHCGKCVRAHCLATLSVTIKKAEEIEIKESKDEVLEPVPARAKQDHGNSNGASRNRKAPPSGTKSV